MSIELKTNPKTGEKEVVFYGNREQCEKMNKLFNQVVNENKTPWYDE